MKKSDLKTGMILELESGKESIVLLNTESGDVTCDNSTQEIQNNVRLHNYFGLENLSEDLKGIGYPQQTVVKVFDKYHNLLWERKEEKPILELDGVEYSESTLRSLIKKALEN